MGGQGMTLTSLIIFLLIGAVAGWLAGQIMKGAVLALSATSSSALLARLLGAGCSASWASLRAG
jgi:uncharacterized membrane protein YeaQ/YmgE (transglycosylase-associated protein family)